MARKKKTEEAAAPSREWHKKAMAVFMEQVGAGESTTGFTFDEIRAHMDLTPDVEGHYEIAAAMTDLRDEGFLAHKFSHDLLKEDFFVGNPTDIPNIQKRENEKKIRQTVFYVSPSAMAISDEEMEGAVDSASIPETKLPEGKTVFTRTSMREWMETLGEMIDTYSTDPKYNIESAKMIAALMPER